MGDNSLSLEGSNLEQVDTHDDPPDIVSENGVAFATTSFLAKV